MALVTVQRSPTPSATSSPCVSEADSGEEDQRSQTRSISESFLTVKGAAVFLPRGNVLPPPSAPRAPHRRSKHAGDLQQHLQTMYTLLRQEDSIRLAVRLESTHPHYTRYMVVVTTNGRQDTEESVLLGIDFASSDSACSVGLVLPLWSDTLIHLDGDGGFSVSTVNRVHVFKPVSVQAMWSALQSLHKACEVARCHNYYPGSLFLTWVSYYQSRVASDQACINEWNAMQDVQSHRADSPVLFTDVPTKRERTERLIKARLREIMMQKDLENVTSKEIRTELEMQMVCNLREFKEFIDNEMIVILGQMDSPTEIFEHVYLGSEWNASNLEELQSSGVRFILNVTREIDNFFPGLFEYHNIRVYDEEATDLLAYWNDTYKFISKAKKAGSKCLVHCKMGVSRSASTVIAYAMKEYGWDLERAFDHVKERRTVAKPNPSFMRQLEEYQGILLASKQRHNKLWRSHSDGDLSERREAPCKAPHTLGHSDPHNDFGNSPPSLQNFLDTMDVMAAASGRHAADLPDIAQSLKDPPIPAVPWPRVATVVPEDGLDHATVTVVETLPVGRPHPPPSLHLLLPSSSPLTMETDLNKTELPAVNEDPTELPTAVPEEKCTTHSAQNGLESISYPAGSHGISVAVPDTGSDMQVSLDTHVANGPVFHTPTTDNMNNDSDPSEIMGSFAKMSFFQCSTSPLGSDSIDFFTAREKFVGLSQGCEPCWLSEQAASQTGHLKHLVHELQPRFVEDAMDDPMDVPSEEEVHPVTVCSEGDTEHLYPEEEALLSPHCFRPSAPALQEGPDADPAGSVVAVLSFWEEEREEVDEYGAKEEPTRPTCDTPLTCSQHASNCCSSPASDSASYTEVLPLEGVTEEETDTDGPVTHGTELQGTWETLQEQQEYVCEEDEEMEPVCGQVCAQDNTGNCGHQDSPPLTKLGFLGCASNHLLSLSLGAYPMAQTPPLSPSASEPYSLPTGAFRKPGMSLKCSPCPSTDTVTTHTPSSMCGHEAPASLQTSPLSPPGQHETDSSKPGTALAVTTATRQQYGKTHPVRRLSRPLEKKRTSNFLYNTM